MSGAVRGLGGTRAAMPRLRLPLIDHVWRVRGAVPIEASLSPQEVFARIEPLVNTPGTTLAAEGAALTYAKRNPAAQDRLATFTRGRMWVERAGAGAVLRFDLFSHALLLCFLAPLLFVGFAQLALAIEAREAAAEKAAAQTAAKAREAPKPPRELHPVDEFLGAPAPEDPNRKKQPSGPTPAQEGYFMAGLFALIYAVGRWLEPFLLRRRLRAALAAPPAASAPG